MCFGYGATAALDGVPTQGDNPQHVGEEGEPRRPANVNSGTISLRPERKYKNRRVQHKSGEAKEWQTVANQQSKAKPAAPLPMPGSYAPGSG